VDNAVPCRFSPAEALRKIQLILEEGIVDFTTHCRRRMRERGANDLDVVHVLRNGQIRRESEWDSDHNNWKYRVQGTDIEGDELPLLRSFSRRIYRC
jgi:hypothetical protein